MTLTPPDVSRQKLSGLLGTLLLTLPVTPGKQEVDARSDGFYFGCKYQVCLTVEFFETDKTFVTIQN